MPVTKLGQSSSNEVNDLQQKHWDVDMKIRDMMAGQSLNAKMALAARLPRVMDEIESEMKAKETHMQGVM